MVEQSKPGEGQVDLTNEADSIQVAELLQRMEDFDRTGVGSTTVTLPPEIAKPFTRFLKADNITAQLSTRLIRRFAVVPPEDRRTELGEVVFTTDVPVDLAIPNPEDRIGVERTVASVSYIPIYPYKNRGNLHDTLYVHKSSKLQEFWEGGGSYIQALWYQTRSQADLQSTPPRRKFLSRLGSRFHRHQNLGPTESYAERAYREAIVTRAELQQVNAVIENAVRQATPKQ